MIIGWRCILERDPGFAYMHRPHFIKGIKSEHRYLIIRSFP